MASLVGSQIALKQFKPVRQRQPKTSGAAVLLAAPSPELGIQHANHDISPFVAPAHGRSMESHSLIRGTRRVALVLAAAFLAPSLAFASDDMPAPRPATDQELALFRAEAETILLDAPSARFAKAQVVEEQHVAHLCLLVNSKSKMGAYVGYAPAYAILTGKRDGAWTAAMVIVTESGAAARKVCADHGVHFRP